MTTNDNEKPPKNAKKIECILCDFKCCKQSDFNRHVLTIKHSSNVLSTKNRQKTPKHSGYECLNCYKQFNDRAGLWRHKKKCNDADVNSQQLVEFLMKENSEFKQLMVEQNKQMIELAKNTGSNNNNTTITNSNNKQFNLNFFLNDTCKNAMNIMDFVSQLKIENKDLEETGRLGFAEGISKMIINGLKQMSISDRPIHCSDSKRETLYIRNNNEWNKETDERVILTNAIRGVTHKNIKQISNWSKEHPDCNDSSSKQNDKYLKIVCESMSGSSSEETNKNYNKIIKNIVKETVINR